MPITPNDRPVTPLSVLVHGEAKVGKTWLAATAPKPMVLLDVDGSSNFIPQTAATRRVLWSPHAPPPAPGEWDIAVVRVRAFEDALRVNQWLMAGKHPFRSAAIDTLDELQRRCADAVVGTSNPDKTIQQDDWGRILRHMEQLLRQMRDLAFHPAKPLECLVITAHTSLHGDKYRPYVKGQLDITLPGIPDVLGFLFLAESPDGTVRKMRIAPSPKVPVLCGDRTHVLSQRLGSVITNPNLESMIEVLHTKQGEPA